VIGGGDDDSVEVVAVDDFSEVLGGELDFLTGFGDDFGVGAIDLRLVDVAEADGLDVLDAEEVGEVVAAHAAAADQGDADAVISAEDAGGGGGGSRERGGAGEGGGGEKTTAGSAHIGVHSFG